MSRHEKRSPQFGCFFRLGNWIQVAEEDPDEDASDGDVEPEWVSPAGDGLVCFKAFEGGVAQGCEDEGESDSGGEDMGDEDGKIEDSEDAGSVEVSIAMDGMVRDIADKEGG